MIRLYSELMTLPTLLDRFDYLKLSGIVAEETFYGSRLLNQKFYRTLEWKRVREYVIRRDEGCELGLRDYPIMGDIVIHHINPITKDDLLYSPEKCLDPEYLICVSPNLHRAIHFSDVSYLENYKPIERRKGDTILWR